MPIATKNGSIIVKDGKVAENCDCCGGWYCYGGASDGVCNCICEDSGKTLPGTLLFTCTTSSWPPADLSDYPNPAVGSLSLIRTGSCNVEWIGQYGSTITVRVVGRVVDRDTSLYGNGMNLEWYYGPIVNGKSYSNTLLTSSGAFSAGAGKSALRDICNGVSMPVHIPPGFSGMSAYVQRGD